MFIEYLLGYGNHVARTRKKSLFWLLLKGRLNTRHLLRRKTMFFEDYNCAICIYSMEKTLQQLFLDEPFAVTMWNTLGVLVHHTTDPWTSLSPLEHS